MGRHQQPELAFSIFLGQSPPFSKHTKHVDFVSKPALASSGFVFIINWEEVCTKGSLRPGRPQVTSLHPLALPLHLAPPLTGRPRCSHSISPGGSCHTRCAQRGRHGTDDKGTQSSWFLQLQGRSCPRNSRQRLSEGAKRGH